MRIMAIDYGEARTGAAVSDATGMLAGEAWVIFERNTEKLLHRIVEEAASRAVEKIVMGYPRNMDGSLGPRAEKYAEFAQLLREASGLPVELWDERRTTIDAHRILSENGRRGQKHKQTVDAVAASLILEGYLNAMRIEAERGGTDSPGEQL